VHCPSCSIAALKHNRRGDPSEGGIAIALMLFISSTSAGCLGQAGVTALPRSKSDSCTSEREGQPLGSKAVLRGKLISPQT